MDNRLITEHRKSGLYFLIGLVTCCIIYVSVFMYVYIFTDEEVPLFPIIMMLLVGVFVGFILLKSDPAIEIDLNSSDILVRLPVSLTKFLYSKNEIIGFNTMSQMHITKHPFNHTYIFISLYFFTTDNKMYGVSSVTTKNFEDVLTYFYNIYPVVSDKLKPYSEEKKEAQYKSVLNQIEEDKRNFWKQKKKDLLAWFIIMIAIGLFYFLLYNYGGE
jgi:hypothetical protein